MLRRDVSHFSWENLLFLLFSVLVSDIAKYLTVIHKHVIGIWLAISLHITGMRILYFYKDFHFFQHVL